MFTDSISVFLLQIMHLRKFIAVSLWIYVRVSVGFIPQSGIVGHRVCICSAVLDTVKQFSKVVNSIYLYESPICST